MQHEFEIHILENQKWTELEKFLNSSKNSEFIERDSIDRIKSTFFSPGLIFYGLYSGQKLFGIVGVRNWENMPYASITRLMIDSGPWRKSDYLVIYKMMAHKILSDMLKNGRTSFFYAMKSSHFFRHNFMEVPNSWTDSTVPIFKLFQFNFEYYHDGESEISFKTIASFLWVSKRPMFLRRGTIRPHVFKMLFVDKMSVDEVLQRLDIR